jgi:tricorn protease
VPGGTRTLDWALGRITALCAAPSGTQLALANHRNELWVGDTASGALTRIDHSGFGRFEDPVWSPCGGWLAYTAATSMRHTAIKLAEVAGGRTLLATQAEFRDYAPAFDPEGRYLYFLSLRTYDPVYDAVQFELSFPRAARPYLIALQAGGAPPFEPAPKGMKHEPRHEGAGGDEAASPGGGKPGAPLPAIQPEGLARRVAAFPVAEGRFGQIAGIARGKVVWTALPLPGAHGRGGHKEGPGRLEVFDFDTGEVKTLLAQADHIVRAADAHTLLVRTGTTLRVLDATRRPDDRPRPGADKPSRDSGLLELGRVRVAVDPPAEWARIFAEVWRLQRDHFWVEDMSGVDWAAVRQRYLPLLPRVATRGELSDLIWELQGELGTSHAYEMGGDHRRPPAVALGHLAADLQPAAAPAQGWQIVRTVQGDAWDRSADSPLNAIGVAAQPGECIVAVGGQPVDASLPPQAQLVHQAGSKVALTLADAQGQRREVLVTALADETPARYREWVERNRAWVHQASGGRVGYLHLPDMMSAGFAEFHRYFGTECDRDALVVDVRYNRGGHVSQLLLEKVARRRIAWTMQRWGQPGCYPDEAPAGPVVALTNEHAGSDGDIFSHGFKLMGIGTLVGQRTWGGVIGIWPRHKLVDGTETTQPEYSFWFKDVGWGVENFGTEPQVEVVNTPQDDAFNAPERDRQLQAALAQALGAVPAEGVYRPAFGPRPQLGR